MPVDPTPTLGRSIWAGRRWRRETVPLLALLVLALALRWPNYQTNPGFSDEVEEVYVGLMVARGEVVRLTNYTPIIGSFWNYLVAASFWLSGFNLVAPRTLILIIGVLTVAATYALGRTWGGPLGGLAAGMLLSTSAVHIAINSHIAWSNCATPLFTTLGVWLLATALAPAPSTRAVASGRPSFSDGISRRGRRLLLAGLCWGLALQTHPSVLGLLPGAAAYLLWRGRPLLRTRWPYLAGALFVLVNLNLLVYNLTSGFGSVANGMTKAVNYTDEDDLLTTDYFNRLALFGLGLLQNLGGAVEIRDNFFSAYWLDPALWPVTLLAAVGVVWQWRRGNPLPGLLLVSDALVLPIFNSKYNPILNGRYLVPLLPVLFAALGSLLPAYRQRLRRGRDNLAVAWFGPPLVTLLGLFLLLHPLVSLVTFYGQAVKMGRTNDRLFETMALIKANRHAEEAVVVDQALGTRRIGWGTGWISRAFRLALALDEIPFQLADPLGDELLQPARRCADLFVVLDARRPEAIADIIARLGLRSPTGGSASAQPPADTYYIYRLNRLPAVSGTCPSGT